MTRTLDSEDLRRRLEADYGVSLPAFRCHGGWEVPLRQILEEAKIRGLLDGLVVEEIKEKFGGLRVYTRPPDRRADEWRRFNRKVRKIEDTSLEICEQCGESGSQVWEGGLLLTLCGPCAAERCALWARTTP